MKPGLLSKEQNAAVNICFVLLIIFSAGKIHAQMFCPCGLSLVVQALSEMSLNLSFLSAPFCIILQTRLLLCIGHLVLSCVTCTCIIYLYVPVLF